MYVQFDKKLTKHFTANIYLFQVRLVTLRFDVKGVQGQLKRPTSPWKETNRQLFQVHFQGEWHGGIACYTQNRKVCGISLKPLVRIWEPTSLRGSRWPSARTWKIVVINIGWERKPPCRWSKVGLPVAKWPIKNYSFLIYDICMVVRNSKVATSLSIFSINRPPLAQQRKQIKSNYKFW